MNRRFAGIVPGRSVAGGLPCFAAAVAWAGLATSDGSIAFAQASDSSQLNRLSNTQQLLMSAVLLAVLFGPTSDRLARPSPAALYTSGQVRASLLQKYGDSALVFEPNIGQAGGSVKFLSRGDGYLLSLGSNEAVVQLRRSIRRRENHEGSVLPDLRPDVPDCTPLTIRIQMVGANSNAAVIGLGPLTTRTNYFIGNDRTRWRTDVPTFSKVRYENEYPGIDLVFYGQQRSLEHDWVVRPGGDPSAIELAFGDAEQLELDDNGDLLVHSASDGDVIRQRRPVAESMLFVVEIR